MPSPTVPEPTDPSRPATLEGPVASASWSPDFLAQALELLIVHRSGAGIRSLRPIHAPSVQIGWGPGKLADVVLGETLRRYHLSVRVLHSTSWRHDGDHVVLTYLAVVDEPAELNPNLASEPVARAELARGAETAAPVSIATVQVLEHALRHLAWLIVDDPAVSAALPDWREPLAVYVPEPFSGL